MSAPRSPLAAADLVAVAVGGALGALVRWALGEAVPEGAGFPWTTLGVNVSGAFLLALLPGVALVRRRRALMVALGPGLLGGFTSFSTYADQARGLVAAGDPGLAGAYVVATVAGCVGAVLVGHRIARRWGPPEIEL